MGRGAGEVGMGRRRGGGKREGMNREVGIRREGKAVWKGRKVKREVTLSEVGSKLTGKIYLEFRKVFPSP